MRGYRALCVLGTAWALASLAVSQDIARAIEFRVDCAATAGTIRPLHGVNGGPLNCGEIVDLSSHWRELAIPLTRLHDCEWPNPDVVDMHAVFPSLDADPASPASYRFSRTDDYLRAIVGSGAGMVYRLGESIEHSRRKYHVAPPADGARWAAACLGIIRHYNEGWADGFHHKIRYWEIWNEPENRPAMWTGSDEDYYRLYATAARAIKTRYPDLKVGGPSVGATGSVVEGRLQPTAFLEGFIEHCRANDLPLDFFSWHTYSDDPSIYRRKAQAIRRWLDEHGLRRTEIHLNEWNFLPDNDWGPMLRSGQGAARELWYQRMGGPAGAAFVAYVLIDLQDSPVDVANYYSGDSIPFGLFTRHGAPKKTFHAMKAFRMLLDTPLRVRSSGGQANESALCAGVNQQRTEATVLLSNYRAAGADWSLVVENLPWPGPTQCKVFQVDRQHDLELVAQQSAEKASIRAQGSLPAPGVLVVRLTADDGEDSP